MAQIKITIPKTGLSKGARTPVVDVTGVVGTSCTELTSPLLERLGTKAAEEVMKPEYYQSVEQKLDQQL
jgi:hypothetical protein